MSEAVTTYGQYRLQAQPSVKGKQPFHVRLGDLVPHEVVRIKGKNVRALVKLFRMGFACLPIEADPVWREHFTQGPCGMESIGSGYGIVDGHHRHAALLEVFGPRHIVEVVSPANFEGQLPAHPQIEESISVRAPANVERTV